VLNHRLGAPTAALAFLLAAGVALVPGTASAAAPHARAHAAPRTASAAATASSAASASASALRKAASSALPTFSSPASKSVREQAPVARPAGGHASAAGTADSGRTIYATTDYCTVGTGSGTSADPYCSVQLAVNAAAPGDTIDVTGSIGHFSYTPVTVRTSGISIVGTSPQSWIRVDKSPAIILDDVSDVTVSNLMLTASHSSAVEVIGSSGITFDSDYLSQDLYGSASTMTVDGGSSDVTVSRTYVDTGGWAADSEGVAIAPGARSITLASDVLAASGISADGVNGLDATGDTIQRGCTPAVDVEGTSTGVHLENNLLEDANPNTDYMLGGYASQCATKDQPWAPDITVAAGSAAATTSDYNDFYVYGDDATAPYSWAGKPYTTLAAFRSGAAEGAHDTLDTSEASPVWLRENESQNVDMQLNAGSAAIGSANPNAPGRLNSDFFGTTPYTSRGAVNYSPNPTLSLALLGQYTSGRGLSLTADVDSAYVPISYKVSWGDGTTTVSKGTGNGFTTWAHTYPRLGTYLITVTLTDSYGDVVANSATATTAGADYTAYGPTRLLDTRDGTGAPEARVTPEGTVSLRIAGNGRIPNTVSAVALNVTVTNASASGFITAYDDGDSLPATSDLDFSAGRTVANQVIVPVGQDGAVDLYNGSDGTVDLVADVAGYFTRSLASGYTPIAPDRLIDTRYGTGTARKPLAGHSSFTAQVVGADSGRLPRGVTAVAVNLTGTGSGGAGYLTAYPDGAALPDASNLDYSRGQTVADAAIAPVGADGRIRVYNGGAQPTDVIVDVVGYYRASGASAYLPVTPVRLLDTRASSWTAGPLPDGSYLPLPVSAGTPDVTACVLNATVTDTRGNGDLSVSPDPNTASDYQNKKTTPPVRPDVSTLNWLRGQTVPNLVQASTGSTGIIDFWNTGTGSTDLVVDAFGIYEND
jgi:hypothetical protein